MNEAPFYKENMSENKLWDDCLEHFRSSLPTQQFNSWIKPLSFHMVNDAIVITAPNSFALKIVQEKFLPEISKLLEKATNKISNIELRVINQGLPEKKVELQLDPTPIAVKPSNTTRRFNRINPSHTFENFVLGKANQFAHAAAYQVSEFPGTSYNPLFIYGGVGLGKTHLLQAIGNQIQNKNPKAKICYVHATNYISDVVRAFQTKNFDEFKQFYNSLDLLLIDDIQFIADKPGTQQEFFYTLTSLIENRRQVVITCDTFPKEISGMEPRLTSRFSWGLTVAIEPPELEMRVAILLQKAIQLNNQLDENVAFFIAKHIRSNVRELEGALIRIEAYSKFHRQPITVELAKESLKDLLALQNKQISIENIQKTVADYYRIKILDLLSKKRTRVISRPRQIAMCLARELTQLSLPEIGSAFGGRDHTTVLHACKTIENLKNIDSSLNSDFNTLNQILRG